jgi:hypothetical protein
MVAGARRFAEFAGLLPSFRGLDEAVEHPLIAAASDHDLAVWVESKRHSWAVNTMVLATIRDRLRSDRPQ